MSNMKLIMENWNKFMNEEVEDDIETIRAEPATAPDASTEEQNDILTKDEAFYLLDLMQHPRLQPGPDSHYTADARQEYKGQFVSLYNKLRETTSGKPARLDYDDVRLIQQTMRSDFLKGIADAHPDLHLAIDDKVRSFLYSEREKASHLPDYSQEPVEW